MHWLVLRSSSGAESVSSSPLCFPAHRSCLSSSYSWDPTLLFCHSFGFGKSAIPISLQIHVIQSKVVCNSVLLAGQDRLILHTLAFLPLSNYSVSHPSVWEATVWTCSWLLWSSNHFCSRFRHCICFTAWDLCFSFSSKFDFEGISVSTLLFASSYFQTGLPALWMISII